MTEKVIGGAGRGNFPERTRPPLFADSGQMRVLADLVKRILPLHDERGLCYAGKPGEIGGVIEPRIHLSQAAILFRKTGQPLGAVTTPKKDADRKSPSG